MDFLTDLAGYMKVGNDTTTEVKHSSNTRAGKDMDMSDYLQLMVASFQNQSIDDVASTSDMMNQMVQMSVIQAVTNLSSIVSDSSSMSYAASLVGKEVTIGLQDGNNLSQLIGEVAGTGKLDGEQVIFLTDGQMFKLSEVIAVGRVPDSEENTLSISNSGPVGSASDASMYEIPTDAYQAAAEELKDS